MQYSEKLKAMRDFVFDNISDIEALCSMFSITIEDLINAFPDKLVKQYSRTFGTIDDDDEDDAEEDMEGWHIFSPEDEPEIS